MTIDWITVSAQIVNFLILVWLLKHFLYGPVTEAMSRREARIIGRLEEAADRERAAESARLAHQRAREQLEAEREQALSEARAAGESERQRLQQQIREEMETVRERWHQQIRAEQAEFLARLKRQTLEAVVTMARKALGDLADVSLEACMIAAFVRRLETLDEAERRTLQDEPGPVQVVTAFTIEDPDRERVTAAVRALAGADRQVEFSRSAELICGIELLAGGHRISWSVGEFSDDLLEQIEHMLALPAASHGPAAES